MKNYTVDQFLEDVRKEAAALRANATPEEIGRLDPATFDPHGMSNCIYGQMTGTCTSVRAADLIFTCCRRYVDNGDYVDDYRTKKNIIQYVNGEKIEAVNSSNDLLVHRGDGLIHLSALEGYILCSDANIEGLFSYLKGETETLSL